MDLDLIIGAVALIAAGTPLGYVARLWQQQRAGSPPSSPPAPNALAEGLEGVRYLDHRIELAPDTLEQLGAVLSRVLADHAALALRPAAPERRATMPDEPEVRIAKDMATAIERGAKALQQAAADQGRTIPYAVARQQAAEMVFSHYEPADWPAR